MTIDCMTCLIQHANGLPTGGEHVDQAGVTHATIQCAVWVVVVCTLAHGGWKGVREWYIVDETVRV